MHGTNMKTDLSLYDVLPTCFDLYMAILREVSNKGIKQWQIVLKTCICGVKNTKLILYFLYFEYISILIETLKYVWLVLSAHLLDLMPYNLGLHPFLCIRLKAYVFSFGSHSTDGVMRPYFYPIIFSALFTYFQVKCKGKGKSSPITGLE